MVGLIFQLSQGGMKGILEWSIGVLFPCILLFLFLALKMIGAADIKLLSVISGIYGIAFIINVVIWSLVFGSIFSIIHMIRNHNFFQRILYFFNYIKDLILEKEIKPYYQKEKDGNSCIIPYAIPVGLAFVLCLFGAEKVTVF